MNFTVDRTPVNTSRGYSGNMTVLNRKGLMSHSLQSCKETTAYVFFQQVVMNATINSAGYHLRGECNRKRPRFVMYTPDTNEEKLMNCATRVLAMLNAMHKLLNLKKKPRVSVPKQAGDNGIIFTVDPWLYRFPVNHHFLMTFVRVAIQKPHIAIDDFNRVVTAVSKESDEKDGHQVRTSLARNVLPRILDKSLDCYADEGYQAWFRRDATSQQMPYYRGIATYADITWPGFRLTPADLIRTWGYLWSKDKLLDNPGGFNHLTQLTS